MTTTIALAGKGGVGKTTIAGMVIKYLAQNQDGAIMAIDADPSSNLNMVLGLDLEWTVGDIREGMLAEVQKSLLQTGAAMGTMPGGSSKQDYLDYEVRSSLSEGDRFDLIAMGRPEGAGCYCAVNHSLREVVDSISKSYRYVIIDNEAGMEHLSRRTTRDVDHLLMVSDPTQRGIVATERIAAMVPDLGINVENIHLILNRVVGDLPAPLMEKVNAMDVNFLGTVPSNNDLMEFEYSGRPLVELGDESPVYQAVAAMMQGIL
ncbi:MAG: AAA family ATPase [Anaerolineales bacterium]|uniref:AAA family ATPase n=1 Tax=Candidatus Desulfolinea nitratireducens TaxID=2841698 RepID=A0A8J6TE06_9CHLR|nr:AAA family ATPase [Candidatus Desulfolinea nitratireducens]MBL6959872.1 AAA family ATPase [Anaerolineales bacterium]